MIKPMFHFDLVGLIKTAGYLGLFAIIFAESGLFIGFFLPGDSLLFTAGFLASQGYLHIELLATLMVIAAVLGDNVGYAFGRRIGPKIFSKEQSILFSKKNLLRAQNFFEEHGRKTIILARFIPAVRTFVPILAGVGQMQYHVFFAFNIVGGLLWAAGLTLLGYFLGSTIPDVDRYLLPIIGGIIALSVLPTIIHIIRDKETRKDIIEFIRSRGKS
ncbi:MAG: hypothetical protein A2751_02740 [Candidatus Doudnabacteria bacterium RIFCSPHIGHO2_01_FULL_46_14]|uniref:VTT domain-containing protein n=1 Tax=Candidatus Doudnabacteria bacterium RIFCSPHIGHO2_01_FULL_46_14 TaxID=1817824 RepID=A0A1F5NJW0_9BACT|nr:MAG: hypothetical protein A2751_02740 [Candidatus Doudnabacteria bacterium RIFCSPHIGHO2_01_FULL_46_14]